MVTALIRRYLALTWLLASVLLGTNAAPKCKNPQDIMLLLDGSRSVRPSNFILVKSYVKNFTRIFDKFGPEATQIGVVQFGSTITEEIRLNQYTDRNELEQAIEDIRYKNEGTMTGEALKYMVETAITPSHGSRLGTPDVRSVAIIVTDGKSQDYFRGTVTYWSEEAKRRGIEIFAIGVGRKANDKELEELASEPLATHKFHVANFDSLKRADIGFTKAENCVVDVDECADESLNNCEHKCVDTEDSFVCDCFEGYDLQEDGFSCLGSDYNPYGDYGFVPTPSDLITNNITHTTCSVSWYMSEADAVGVDKYKVTYTDGVEEKTIYVPGNTTTVVLMDLVSSTTYAVSVRSVQNPLTEDDDPLYSDAANETFTTLALGRTQLTVESPTLTTLTAKWTAAGGDGLTGYEIFIQRERDETDIGVTPPEANTHKVSADVLEIKLTGLTPDSLYTARVIPLHGPELVGISGTDTRRTSALTAPKVVVVNTTLTTMAFKWKHVNHPVENWELKVYAKGSEEAKMAIVSREQRHHISIGLTPSTLYNIEVVGNVTEGGRYFSTPAGKGHKKTKSLKKPKVEVTDATPISLVITWKKINVEPVSWSVKIFPKGGSKHFKTAEVDGAELSTQFDELIPNTMYKAEVEAIIEEHGQRLKSEKGKQKGKTLPLSAPPVQVTATTHSSLTATWEEINAPVDDWFIELKKDGEVKQDAVIPADQHEVNFGRLESEATYDVFVVGRINDLPSPKGEATGNTKQYLPPVINCTSATLSSLTIDWSYPEDAGTWTVKIYPEGRQDYNRESIVQGDSANHVELLRLLPSTTYVIEIGGLLAIGDRNEEMPPARTTCNTAPLSAPPVNVVSTTDTSMAVKWEPINAPVNSWKVDVFQQGKPDIVKTADVQGTEDEIEIDDLTPSTVYSVIVTGHVTEAGIVVVSPPGSAVGETKPPVPTISNLTVTQITHTTARVQWDIDVSDDVVDSYALTYVKSEEDDEPIPLEVEDRKWEVLIELTPSTKYNVSVLAVNAYDTSYPVEGTFTTKSLGVVELTLENPTLTTLTAQWTLTQGDDVTGYDLAYWDSEGEESKETLGPEENKFVLTSLKPGTLYHALATPLHGELTGQPGSDEETTGFMDPPQVTAAATTHTSINVKWEPINVPVNTWTVTVVKNGTDEPIEIVDVQGDQGEIGFDDLIPSTLYDVTVVGNALDAGVRVVGPAGYAEGTTKPAPPIPSNLTVSQITHTTARVQWDIGDVDEDAVDYYILTYVRADGDDEPTPVEIEGQTSTVLTELKPFEKYNISVVAVNAYDTSASVNGSFTTKSLGTVVLTLTDPTLTTLTAQWTLTKGDDVTGYDLAYWDSEGGEIHKMLAPDNNDSLLNDLDPGTLYYARVLPIHGELSGEPGSDEERTASLAQPAVEVTRTTDVTLEAEWQDINADVASWTVNLYLHGSTDAIQTFDKEAEEHEIRFDNLQPSTSYDVQVVGHVTENDNELSTPPGVAQGATKMTIPTPSNLRVTKVTHTTARVQWDIGDVSDDVVDYYMLTYQESEKGEQISLEIRNKSALLTDLQPSTRYDVSVRAVNDYAISDQVSGNFTTKSLGETALTLEDPTLSTLTARWTLDGGDSLTGFELVYKKLTSDDEPESEEIRQKCAPDQRELLLTGLEPGTQYTASVTPLHGKLTGVAGSDEEMTISLDAPKVKITFITDTMLIADWEDTNVPVNNWSVELLSKEGGVVSLVNELRPEQRSMLFTELEPLTSYDVQVQGFVSDNNEVYRTPPGITEGTTKSPIPTPAQLTFSEITHTSARGQWNIGNVSDDVVDHYIVTLIAADGSKDPIDTEVNDEKTIVWSELDPATKYNVSIIAVNDYAFSDPVQGDFVTKTLGKVTLTLVNATLSTLTAEWTHVGGDDLSQFLITYHEVTEELNGNEPAMQKEAYYPAEARSAKLSSLKPGTLYETRIVALYGTDGDLPGDAATDEERTDSLIAPVVTVTNSTLSTIGVSWKPVNYYADTWVIEIASDDQDYLNDADPVVLPSDNLFHDQAPSETQHYESTEISGDELDTIFTGLQPDTEYSIDVIGHVVDGGQYFITPKGIITGKTKMLSTPEVGCQESTDSTVTVYWPEFNPEPASWTLTVYPEGRKENEQALEQPGDEEMEAVIRQLPPATTYIIELTANMEENQVVFNSPKANTTCTTHPAPPRNIEVTDRELTNLEVSFDPSFSSADYYVGECVPVNDNEEDDEDATEGTFISETVMECNDLDPATKYDIAIRAVYKELESDPISIRNATLTPPPSGLTLLDPSVSTMVAEWQPLDMENVDSYIVSYKAPFDEEPTSVSVDGDTTLLLLENLEPNTLYTVQVQAVVDGEESSPDEAEESTLEEVIQIQIDEVGFTNINVSWNPSEVPSVQAYCIQIAPSLIEEPRNDLCFPIDLTENRIFDLETAQEYRISIAAKYPHSRSEKTEKLATTLALPPIGPITFTNVTETSFTAHWIPPETERLVSYVVTYFTEGMEPIIVNDVDHPFLDIPGLNPMTVYNVTVSAKYPNNLLSHPIAGAETTLEDIGMCSCGTYLRAQTKMQSMMLHLMGKIESLTRKIDLLTEENPNSDSP
ncbi:collagen alpha-1(XII) chain-like [Clavelina lepadiformis]|uniref:collagen alpha-1(XII) chain-like n=1 Tax=Clavelina lepadiformis TaxID=159417 RepID=UPI0040416621